MPVTIGEYPYEFADPTLLTTPQRVAKPRPSYPIEGDSKNYIYEEDYMVFIDYYVPLQPNARHVTRSNLFFVSDSPITDIGNGIGRFTRQWSVLPGSADKGYQRTEYESFAYTVPAVDTAQTSFYQFPISANSTAAGITTVTVTTGAAPFDSLDLTVGKPTTIYYIVTDPQNGQQQNRQVVKEVLSKTTNTATFTQIVDIGTITYVGIARTDLTQPSYTKQLMSKVIYDYFIEGVNCTSVDDIPLIQELQIIDNSTGGRTTTLSETSTPSFDDWLDGIQDGTYFCVEPSVVTRWRGGIWQRQTRYIKMVK